jgi:hypothetical protein
MSLQVLRFVFKDALKQKRLTISDYAFNSDFALVSVLPKKIIILQKIITPKVIITPSNKSEKIFSPIKNNSLFHKWSIISIIEPPPKRRLSKRNSLESLINPFLEAKRIIAVDAGTI